MFGRQINQMVEWAQKPNETEEAIFLQKRTAELRRQYEEFMSKAKLRIKGDAEIRKRQETNTAKYTTN
jgi:hypothetical protein